MNSQSLVESFKMKLCLIYLLAIYFKLSSAGGDNPCGSFEADISSIRKEIEVWGVSKKELTLSTMEQIFSNKKLTNEEKKNQIGIAVKESEKSFAEFREYIFSKLEDYVGVARNSIEAHLLHSSDVSEFPLLCIMDSGQFLDQSFYRRQKSINDYENILLADLWKIKISLK